MDQGAGKIKNEYRQWYFFIFGLFGVVISLTWGIIDFPIYFFCDEAILTNIGKQWVKQGFKSDAGNWFPMYFPIAPGRWTPFLPAYIQGISATLFGNSVLVSRLTSVFFSTLGVIALSFAIKKDNFKLWWITPFIFLLVPIWFLHGRTAFDNIMSLAFLSIFIYSYLLYLDQKPWLIFLPVLAGAALYYTYASSQVYFPVLVLALFISDIKYHFKNYTWILLALPLVIFLAFPLINFQKSSELTTADQLYALNSYLIQNITLNEKIKIFIEKYLSAFNPKFWFFENTAEHIRHRIPGYPNIAAYLIPFIIIGLIQFFTNYKKPLLRILLLTFLLIPIPSALTELSISRALPLVVCFVGFSVIGFEPFHKKFAWIPIVFAIFISLYAFKLLYVSIKYGPFATNNYGMYGLQYGARQIFQETIPEMLKQDPEIKINVSPNWGNGVEVFPIFFLNTEQRKRVTISGLGSLLSMQTVPSANDIIVVHEDEFLSITKTGKFKTPEIIKTIDYPDGRKGFYFIKLSYVDNIQEIINAENEELKIPLKKRLKIASIPFNVEYSRLDSGSLKEAFDKLENTLMRGLNANPFILNLKSKKTFNLKAVNFNFAGEWMKISIQLHKANGTIVTKENTTAPTKTKWGWRYEIPFSEIEKDLLEIKLEFFDPRAESDKHIHIREIDLVFN